MTGPSVAKRPQVVDSERPPRSESRETARPKAIVTRRIFGSWREALRYLTVWVLAGLTVYAVAVVAWLILF